MGVDIGIPGLYRGVMKTAISVPDEVFTRAEVFARRRHMTRSALFALAVDEYVQHHRADDVTRRLNEVYPKEDSTLDPVLEQLQALSLPKEEW
jgi:metal-responsive CopG/Arc/MetJ family transcriptional regulator